MRHLETNSIVGGDIRRQTRQLDQLLEEDVTPHLRVIRDYEGADEIGVRSYTAALRRHAASFAGRVLPLERLVSVRTVNPKEVVVAVSEANEDDSVHGMLVMSPTVEDYETAAWMIDPKKDVDRMNPATRELASGGRRLTPCTPQAVRETLDNYGLWTPGLNYTLVGRGRTVGAFVDEDLKALHGNAYGERVRVITKSNEADLPDAMAVSNVAIVAAGQRRQITRGMISPNLLAVAGVCIDDIDPAVHHIEGDLLVTPPHNDSEHLGIGARTSSIAWENTLGAAALTVGMRS